MDFELGPITVVEAKYAVMRLMNGKSPEYAEILKTEEEEMPQHLQHISQDVCDNEVLPDAWKRGTIVKLPKKGNLSECINWRGITLLSITSNVFCHIILQCITTAANKLLHQEQSGFRKGRSCIDHIFVLCQIFEQSHESEHDLLDKEQSI